MDVRHKNISGLFKDYNIPALILFLFIDVLASLSCTDLQSCRIWHNIRQSHIETSSGCSHSYLRTWGNTGRVWRLGENSWAQGTRWARTSPARSGSSSRGSRRASCRLPRSGGRWKWGSSPASAPRRWCWERARFLQTHAGAAQTRVYKGEKHAVQVL